MTPSPPDNQPEAQSEEVITFVRQLYSNCPRTLITPFIVGTNALIFLFMLTQGAGIMGENFEIYINYGANYGPMTKNDEWWRLLSAMFLHYGILHLAFNMWALWDAGRLTERLYGHQHFAWMYLFAGLLGSLASLYWNNDIVVSVGASGAVFGVFGALLAYLVAQKNTVPQILLKQLMRSALFFMGFSLFYGFAKSGIDNAAHIGGLAGGFALGLLFAKPLSVPQQGFLRQAIAKISAIIIIALGILLAPPALFNYQDQTMAEEKLQEFISEEKRLMSDWRHLTTQLQQGEDLREADLLQTLNDIQSDWLSLQKRIQSYGEVQTSTVKTFDLLGKYAQYRSQNARYLIRFLETADPYYMQQLKENSLKVEAILEKINSLQH